MVMVLSLDSSLVAICSLSIFLMYQTRKIKAVKMRNRCHTSPRVCANPGKAAAHVAADAPCERADFDEPVLRRPNVDAFAHHCRVDVRKVIEEL